MRALYPPTHCPGCGDHLRLDEDALSDGADATRCKAPHEKHFRVQHDACGWQGYVNPDDRWDKPDVDVVSTLRAALAQPDQSRLTRLTLEVAEVRAKLAEAVGLLAEADRYVEDEPELSMRIDAFLARKGGT